MTIFDWNYSSSWKIGWFLLCMLDLKIYSTITAAWLDECMIIYLILVDLPWKWIMPWIFLEIHRIEAYCCMEDIYSHSWSMWRRKMEYRCWVMTHCRLWYCPKQEWSLSFRRGLVKPRMSFGRTEALLMLRTTNWPIWPVLNGGLSWCLVKSKVTDKNNKFQLLW